MYHTTRTRLYGVKYIDPVSLAPFSEIKAYLQEHQPDVLFLSEVMLLAAYCRTSSGHRNGLFNQERPAICADDLEQYESTKIASNRRKRAEADGKAIGDAFNSQDGCFYDYEVRVP